MADENVVSGSGPDGSDINELSLEEQTALALERSNASKEDFNPLSDEHEGAHKNVVELPDRSSHIVEDLVDHPDPVVATDAQSVVDGNYPGGPNYPNGPGEDSAPASSPAPAKKAEAPKPQDSNQAQQ